MRRIEEEKRVVGLMITRYCRRHHSPDPGNDICGDCRRLLEYAMARLDHCPKGDDKGSCRKCEIHCYAPDYRRRIREVMRYMGPRMILIDPVAAIRHIMRELK